MDYYSVGRGHHRAAGPGGLPRMQFIVRIERPPLGAQTALPARLHGRRPARPRRRETPPTRRDSRSAGHDPAPGITCRPMPQASTRESRNIEA
jgi:hypothetical protein